ncbi:thiamine-phosphate kinase [Silanimonas lenta]|uniref:thiamine-phosphate kinase n=1 Tax=Silanimonas lenta TaxID=265429 RepID=UPI002FE30697
MPEFSLIEAFRRRALAREDVPLGIGDDAALFDPPAGERLALAVDTLVEGVHFNRGLPPASIGWKALAVNLSDLAAMGATPALALLALTLPAEDPRFVEELATGFAALADSHRVALAGGDTTRGPLALSVTVVGHVPKDLALRRSGARPGDDVWVSGSLGDAAGALALWKAGTPMLRVGPLRQRLDRPTPRLGAGQALRGLATACIDISDGFLADLGHLLAASGVGAEVEVEALPASADLREAFPDPVARRALQLSGGDDYELCFTAPPSERAAVERLSARLALPLSRVGRITAGASLRLLDADGLPLPLPERRGYVHFAEDGA